MEEWNVSNINGCDELVRVLYVTDKLKNKYPDDEHIVIFEEIIRNEICKLFGGTIVKE